MDPKIAASHIEGLCDRLEPSADGARFALTGYVSRRELEALRLAIQALLPSTGEEIAVPVGPPPAAPAEVELSWASLEAVPSEDLIACLDFGTAFSKAGMRDLAKVADGFFDLPLGQIAGEANDVYPVSSSLFFEQNRILFGPHAVRQSLLTERPRLDSIKRHLSEMVEQVEEKLIQPELNPSGFRFTIRDGVLLYLGYLTDLLGQSVEGLNYSRYVKRRYTLPGLDSRSSQQAAAVNKLMQRLLAEAQVLADTFRGRWDAGLKPAEAYAACRGVFEAEQLPDVLVDEGLQEAVAASQSAVDRTVVRSAMLVVDVGAGTTDIGVFIVQPGTDRAVVAPMPQSMKVLRRAGDRVDEALMDLLLDKCGATRGTQTYALVQSDIQLRVRDLKRDLFASYDQEMDVFLRNDETVHVTSEELHSHPKVASFLADLRKTMTEAFAALDPEVLQTLQGKCRVVLTGGGGRLPSVRTACNDTLEVNGGMVALNVVDAKPDWLDRKGADFVQVFDQMAVAAGGCEDPEEMAKIARPFSAFGGSATPRRVIEPMYKSSPL